MSRNNFRAMVSGRSNAVRYALGIYVACFGIAVLTHAFDFVQRGWLPYRLGPLPLRAFWNALIALDAAIVLLLLMGRLRSGLVLALTVITLDVAANTYGMVGLGLPGFEVPLLFQTAVLGFVFGTIAFVWPGNPAAEPNRADINPA